MSAPDFTLQDLDTLKALVSDEAQKWRLLDKTPQIIAKHNALEKLWRKLNAHAMRLE
jgi:hypothetical protein